MRFNLISLLIVLVASLAVEATARKLNVNVDSFSWSDCGSLSPSGDVIHVQSLQISPDPVLIPGNVSVALQAVSSLSESSPLPLSLTIKKKVTFFWITIPCIDNVGSCDYKDLCALLPIPNPCPTAFKTHDIPCDCPLQRGNYNLPLSPVMTLDSGSIPSWLESGDYKIDIKINDNKDNEILCLDLSLTVRTD